MDFRKFFKINKSTRLTKIEFWEKFQLFELFDLLHQAEEVLENSSNREVVDFKDKFIDELYEIEGDNVTDFTRIWKWFQPEKEWDNFTKIEGKILGQKIFKIVDFWKANHNQS